MSILLNKALDKLAGKVRGKIRRELGVGNSVGVVLVEGNQEPLLNGKRGHFTTITGIQIRFPSAYSKIGWRSMVYHSSTLRIIVGREYFLRLIDEVLQGGKAK